MAYYLDFVGLNTFIYEPVGYDEGLASEKLTYLNGGETSLVSLNYVGVLSNGTDSLPGTITGYKNFLFPYNLSNTASFFPALMLHRNGPYGWPTWKQIRIGENPLTRKQNTENVFTIIEEPGSEVTFKMNGQQHTLMSKYGSILKYDETPVTSKFKPIKIGAGSQVLTTEGQTVLEKFELQAPYANETIFFNNDGLSKRYDKLPKKTKEYEKLTGFYLNGALNSDRSPLDTFQYFKYSETVYPPQIYAWKNYVRQRTTFVFPWRDLRENRNQVKVDIFIGDFNVSQSMWNLDAYSGWETFTDRSLVGNPTRWFWQGIKINNQVSSYTGYSEISNMGILQNQYCFGFGPRIGPSLPGLNTVVNNFPTDNVDDFLVVAPLYNRKHTLLPSSSVVSPNGMRIEGINTGITMNDLTTGGGVPSGEAKWEANSQSGLKPFYNSYDDYIQGVRQKGKGYSIIPEFRISEHVATYQSKGLTEEITNLFSLTGALLNADDSSRPNFYKIYSNSDFMKHFDVIKEDHKEFVDPFSITLKCKGIKKLLPYEGFYPAQRTVQMAKQFYDSYSSECSIKRVGKEFVGDSSRSYYFQNLMVPTFAPGIMFNSIKAGVACDYPVITSSISLANKNVYAEGDNYYLTTGSIPRFKCFDRRIPFEALVEPEAHLTDRLYCNEPHIYANNSGSIVWDGNGDNLYKLMANNFMAETANFFLKDASFTSIVSAKSTNVNVGNAVSGTTYMMRIKMYKSQESGSVPTLDQTTANYFLSPQYNTGSHENFTMYSRPSAFGPPSKPILGTANTGSDSGIGENYAFTPPYYYGAAFCDLSFTATETKKYTINEIMNSIQASENGIRQWRYVDNTTSKGMNKTRFINGLKTEIDGVSGDAMPLNSSVNIFQQGDVVGDGLVVDASGDTRSRWVIQTKYETPMVNFAHLSSSTSITLPLNASQSVPRGMWHQYGQIETDPAKGIFLQVDYVPGDWIKNFLQGDPLVTGSLADLCGFSNEPVKLGQAADSKVIREAVVAVPFIENAGQRQFFSLPQIDIQNAMGLADKRALVGDSVLDMVDKMKRFVIPPSMDFVNNPSIDPFAMYIFEFTHTLQKQDLTDIWQNLYPQIGRSFEEAEATITHGLLAQELLGGGAVITKNSNNTVGALEKNAKGNELPKEIRWMVFKVKQQGEIDYYSKIVGSKKELTGTRIAGARTTDTRVSYNWPYDFFSLVELVKIDAEVTLAQREYTTIPEDSIVTQESRAVQANSPVPPVDESLVDTSPVGPPQASFHRGLTRMGQTRLSMEGGGDGVAQKEGCEAYEACLEEVGPYAGAQEYCALDGVDASGDSNWKPDVCGIGKEKALDTYAKVKKIFGGDSSEE